MIDMLKAAAGPHSRQDILIPGRISVGEVVQLSKVTPKPASRQFLADFARPSETSNFHIRYNEV